MRAVVISGINKLSVRDVPGPHKSALDAIVRVKAVGLCRTDVELLLGKHPSVLDSLTDTNYRIPGHEWSGVVEEAEEGGSFKKGDWVVSEVGTRCGKCPSCKGVKQGPCEKPVEIGIDRNGAMAEIVSVPYANLHKFQSIPFEEAALIETTTVVLRALSKLDEKSGKLPKLDGKNVAVIGDGPVGLLATKVIRLCNPSTLVTIGKFERKLSMARRFGADLTIDSSSVSGNATSLMRREMGDRQIDYVFEAAGGPSSVDDSLGIIRKGGTVVLLGLHGTLPVSLDAIVLNEIHVIGSVSGSDMWEYAIQLVSEGRLALRDLITDVIPLSRAREAFEWAEKDQDRVKTIMIP